MKVSSILLASALALAVAAPTGSAFAAPLKKELEKIKKDEKGGVTKLEKDIKAGDKKGVALDKKVISIEEKKLAGEKKLASEIKPKLGAPKPLLLKKP